MNTAAKVGLAVVGVVVGIQLIPYGRNHSNPPVRQEPQWDSAETRKLAELLKYKKNQNPSLKIQLVLEGEKDQDKPNGVAIRNRLTKDFFAGTDGASEITGDSIGSSASDEARSTGSRTSSI